MDEMGTNILYALLYLFLAPVGGGLLAGLDRKLAARMQRRVGPPVCLLYTSDAADEEDSGDLGGRRNIKKKKEKRHLR